MTTTTPTKGFCDLPLEIQESIFEHYFPTIDIQLYPRQRAWPMCLLTDSLSIFLTCKTVYSTAKSVFLGTYLFEFPRASFDTLVQTSQYFRDDILRIRRVSLRDWTWWNPTRLKESPWKGHRLTYVRLTEGVLPRRDAQGSVMTTTGSPARRRQYQQQRQRPPSEGRELQKIRGKLLDGEGHVRHWLSQDSRVDHLLREVDGVSFEIRLVYEVPYEIDSTYPELIARFDIFKGKVNIVPAIKNAKHFKKEVKDFISSVLKPSLESEIQRRLESPP